MPVISRLKRHVERYPAVALTYRALRDAWRRSHEQPARTPHGFFLIGNRAMQNGTFERAETALLRELLEGADTLVDVGANIGLYTCLARALGKHAIAVEPLPDNLQYLFANLEANGWNDVEVWPLALAERPGTAVLSGASTGASLVAGWAGASPLLRTAVAVSTLDIMLGNRFAAERLVIKVDVEGAEWRMLQGAVETLARRPSPRWLVEINLSEHHPSGRNEHFLDTFQLFWRLGYRVHTADRDRREIRPAEVERWAADPSTAPRGGNYLFSS